MITTTNLSNALNHSLKEPTLYVIKGTTVRIEVIFFRAFIRSYEAYHIETGQLKSKFI